jgi:hypothetical protein
MDELQLKGLYYNCDEKYLHGNKCKEKTLFMSIWEYVDKEEVDVPPIEDIPL